MICIKHVVKQGVLLSSYIHEAIIFPTRIYVDIKFHNTIMKVRVTLRNKMRAIKCMQGRNDSYAADEDAGNMEALRNARMNELDFHIVYCTSKKPLIVSTNIQCAFLNSTLGEAATSHIA